MLGGREQREGKIVKMVKRIFHRNWKEGFIRDKRREAEEDAALYHDTGFAASPEKEEDGEKPVSARCCSCFLISQGHHSKSHKKGNTSDLKIQMLPIQLVSNLYMQVTPSLDQDIEFSSLSSF